MLRIDFLSKSRQNQLICAKIFEIFKMRYLRVFPFALFVFTIALFVVLAFPVCFFFEPKIDEQNVKKRPWRLFLARFARLKRNFRSNLQVQENLKISNLARMVASNSKQEKQSNLSSKMELIKNFEKFKIG
jgi:hypothetical protein